MILGIIDLAQIEARILAWIAGQDDIPGHRSAGQRQEIARLKARHDHA